MAYDEAVAARLRDALAGEGGLAEKKMFGGLAFLLDGHMAVAAAGEGGLLLRCDPADTDAHVAHADVERFEMRGREMNGWLHVAAPAITDDESLQQWVDVGVRYVRTLPPK